MCTIVGVNFCKITIRQDVLAYKDTQCKFSIHKVTYESMKIGHLEKSFGPV
jgi:hypothetical protein